MPRAAFVAAVRTLLETRAIAHSRTPGDAATVEMGKHRVEVTTRGLRCARCGAELPIEAGPILSSQVDDWVREHAPDDCDGGRGCST